VSRRHRGDCRRLFFSPRRPPPGPPACIAFRPSCADNGNRTPRLCGALHQRRAAIMSNHFGSKALLRVGGPQYTIFRLHAAASAHPPAARLPYSLKILLENLLRCEDGVVVRAEDIEALARWDPQAPPGREIAFMPARVLMQDFTGVPSVVDLAAMRDAMLRL